MIWLGFTTIVFLYLFLWQREKSSEQRSEIFRLQKTISEYEDKVHGIVSREKTAEKQIEELRVNAQKEIQAERIHIYKDRFRLYNEREQYKADIRLKQQELDENADCINAEILLKQQELKKKEERIALLESNLTAIPYMSAIIADFDTREIGLLADQLDWGQNVERAKKVISIREIRNTAMQMITQYQEAYYQLEYLKQMFPSITDFLETDYAEVSKLSFNDIKSNEHDGVRDFLSKEEYEKLSESERNQLALDRYIASTHKSNWQIGRDYELYIGFKYAQKGYTIDYYGAYNGLEDLGRDLIARKGNEILIIQCKYWSSSKQIHEKHINQLYGTTICYCLENDIPVDYVHGVLVTNISLSETAKKFAKYLNITVVENFPLKEYPRIKCNINKNSWGEKTKIYHLPFDQQYDSCKIDKPDEFFALTVQEAEAAGFRRAYKWHSQ